VTSFPKGLGRPPALQIELDSWFGGGTGQSMWTLNKPDEKRAISHSGILNRVFIILFL